MRPAMLQGELPGGGMRFAYVVPNAHHVVGSVGMTRFAASLAPFRCEDSARAALEDAGAEIIVEIGG